MSSLPTGEISQPDLWAEAETPAHNPLDSQAGSFTAREEPAIEDLLRASSDPDNMSDWERIQALYALGRHNSLDGLEQKYRNRGEAAAAAGAKRARDGWSKVARECIARSMGIRIPESGDQPFELVQEFERFRLSYGGTGRHSQMLRTQEIARLEECIRRRAEKPVA